MSKVYSVIALLDEASTQAFLTLRQKLSVIEGSYNNTLPHITISIYDKDTNLDELIQWTKKIAENQHKFKVIYKTVGFTPEGALKAIPAFSPQLYALYYNHHQKFDLYCRDYNALKNGEWLPHTGIWYTDKETACANIGKLAEIFQPFEAEITSLRITEFDYKLFTNIIEFKLQ